MQRRLRNVVLLAQFLVNVYDIISTMLRLLRKLSVILALSLMLVAGAFVLLAWQVDRLGRDDQAQPADVIVVLGARVDANGQPGSDLTSRTLHAVNLWQDGLAPHLVCSGGYANEPLSSASVCRNYAIKLGVPAERIRLADGTSNTAEDAQATARVMAQEGWSKAILVSHPLHLFRARWFFRQAGVDAVTSPTTTAIEDIFLPLRLWYSVREAGALVVTTLDGWGWLPSTWTARLESWRINLP